MIKRLLTIYAKLISRMIIVLIFILMVAVALQILGRYIPFMPRFLWTEELVNFSLVWVVFLGSILGVREGRHFYVDFLPNNLSAKFTLVLRVTYYMLLYAVALVFVIYGIRYFKMGAIQKSQTMGINLGLLYISVPFAGLSWVIFLAESIWEEIKVGRSGDDKQ